MFALQRIKRIREEAALFLLREKRQKLQRAHQSHQERAEAARASEASLASRENSAFAEILKKIVDTDSIDLTKEKVQRLHSDHRQLLVDLELALQQKSRFTKEVEEALCQYQNAQRRRVKFDEIVEDERDVEQRREEAKEEAESDDGTTTRGGS